ncbi:MAG: hypothetical protein HY678_09255 [Chloroflexi bacterium]|nr:hypothetical protein [Chloroflexota bacterium]
MRGRSLIVALAGVLAAYLFPALAEANGGDHFQMGGLHFDPLVSTGVGAFVLLITSMFILQWARLSRARRDGAPPRRRRRRIEDVEEDAREE